jgi:acyl-CoA synthetase (NDP forming)
VAELDPLMSPGSVALVGVSDDPKTVRGRLVHILLQRGFPGRLFLVSRSLVEFQGRRIYRSLSELPEPVDLAVIASPARFVPALMEECAAVGVKAVAIVGSGFAEEGSEEGRRLQDAVADIAQAHGLIVCGPNCEGLVSCLLPMAATFSPTLENTSISIAPSIHARRRIGVTSQSGALTFSFLNRSQHRQLAYSYMVSTGNEVCLQTSDYISFMLSDGRTDIVLAYLEGIGDAARFRSVAIQAAEAGTPLVIAQPGRSEAARRGVASHTGSMAGEARVVEAVFRELGIVRGEDLDTMIDIATAFTYCEPPTGTRVGLVSASGGGAVWMADLLAGEHFTVPPFDPDTIARIAALLPSFGSAQNPVDLTAGAIRELGYARVIEIVQGCDEVDAVVVVGSLAYEYGIEKDHQNLCRVVRAGSKPVIFCSYTTASPRAVELLAQAGIAVFTSMPNCARALRALAEHAAFLKRRQRDCVVPQSDSGAAEARRRLIAAPPVLCEMETKAVLSSLGVPGMPERLVQDAAEAAAAAREIGFPVAIKLQSPSLLHKTEARAVVLQLGDGTAVEEAAGAMLARLSHVMLADGIGLLVQKMAEPGIEVIVGVKHDPQFGPMVMIGLGGVLVEALDDVVLAPAPVTAQRATELIGTLKTASVFSGLRGRPPADVPALAEFVALISRFAAHNADLIDEIDLNPVVVHEHDLSVVDALIIKRAPVTREKGTT